jgi:hypothetical protein
MASDNSSDNFAISLNVWGEFEIKATAFFKDGSTKGLSRYLSFSTSSSSSQNSITSTDASSNFLTYEHPVYHYTIQYPSNWEILHGDVNPEFISPLEGINDDRYRANIVIDFSTTSIPLEDSIPVYAQNNPDYQIIESKPINPPPKDVNATEAYMLVYTYKDPNYGMLKAMEIFIKEMDINLYEIRFSATPESYSVYLPIVQKMIDSFVSS